MQRQCSPVCNIRCDFQPYHTIASQERVEAVNEEHIIVIQAAKVLGSVAWKYGKDTWSIRWRVSDQTRMVAFLFFRVRRHPTIVLNLEMFVCPWGDFVGLTSNFPMFAR